jgi:peptidoglycan/LPS O-acetylase OafA/YrhL
LSSGAHRAAAAPRDADRAGAAPAPAELRPSLGRRLAAAFSLRAGLHALFVPAAGHLRPLDGLRALAIVWVVIFHGGWYSAWQLPLETYLGLVRAPWMIPVWRGDFGVDVFFVLSGFLIGGLLLDEQARRGRIALGRFYLRRLMRLWPALVVALVAYVLLLRGHDTMCWATLLYAANFVPVGVVCMGWTWSLAIEEQFYLACPWLVRSLRALRPGARPLALAALILALALLDAGIVVAHGLHARDAEIVIDRDQAQWARAFEVLYAKPWMRAGALLVGVAAAVLYRMRRVMEWVSRARVLPAVGSVLALLLLGGSTHWPLAAGAARGAEVAFLAGFRTTFALGVGWFLLLSLSEHPLGRALGKVLSARVLHLLAQLAYSAYLLNPIVAEYVHGALRGRAMRIGNPMLLFVPADLIATFAAAAFLYLLVERPFMALRPGARPATNP